jgi:predicted outer membrane repeat protein
MKQRLFSVILILAALVGPSVVSSAIPAAQAAGPLCYVDHTAPGQNSGASWTDAYTDLQTALGQIDCTEIRVAAGTYFPTGGSDRNATFALRSGLSLVGGYPKGGGDTPEPAANKTILSGNIGAPGDNLDNSLHVVTASGVDNAALLDGFTVQDGYGEPSTGAGVTMDASSPRLRNLVIRGNVGTLGGGMYIHSGSPTLSNLIFEDNAAPSTIYATQGGGLHLYATDATLTDVTFRNNTARENGGGIFCNNATPRLERVTFEGNSSRFGGGMFTVDGSTQMVDVRFIDNVAVTDGGGIDAVNSPTTVHGCEVTGNTAGIEGGGLRFDDAVTLTDCLFDGNSAGEYGGGLYVNDAGPNIITNVTATNNSVSTANGYGGGIFSGHNAVFTNLVLAGNSAWLGGGFANFDRTVAIANATIYDNYASEAGSAIYTLGGDRTLANIIVWGNTEGVPGPDIVNDSTTSSVVSASVLEGGVCPTPGTCSGIIDSDPQWVDPANGDFRLQPYSPAVDAGDLSALPADSNDLDGDGNTTEPVARDVRNRPRVVVGRVDIGALEAQIWNINWTEAAALPMAETQPDVYTASIDRYLDVPGQSRWYKFTIQPSSQVIVTLTGLPDNYDLALYKDISQAYAELNSAEDLVHLSAEFAPDAFSPDTYSPDTYSPSTFSPDTYSPDTFSPDTYSPDTYSPDTFSPDTYSPDTYSPDAFSPDTYSPDTYSPDTYSPDTYSPDTYSPDTYSPDTYSPDTYSSAQTRSLIAVSAHEGTLGEGIIANTWTKSGEFYVRVRGGNGAFDAETPFHLQVTLLTGVCGDVSPILPSSTTAVTDGGYHTLILDNPSLTQGATADLAALGTNLSALAGRTTGVVVDVGADARVAAAAVQAVAHPACVYAVNLEAYAIKGIVDAFRAVNPLEYVVLVGNDRAIPFFRYTDAALLASEIDYSPPVRDNTTSQASLKSGYTLSQDAYGAALELSNKAGTLPVPDLAVGRLVETASDINRMLAAYLDTTEGVVTPANALVTGYDFLEDAANAVRDELRASLGAAAVDTLIMDANLSPQDPTAWTADDLRSSLLGSSHDIVFLAGHFSANSALAADYRTRMTAAELLASTTDFRNSLVYSAGCHSGYNIVDEHGVQNVTEEPDWAQAFAAKGATFIGGTGYQYGDTEFVEYSERLYLEFTRQLRYGSGPVAVGKALAQAKQAYLADTPLLRGIHEKSLLEATLFGLPMFAVDLPTRISPPSDASIVPAITAFSGDPGASLGLKSYDLNVDLRNADGTSMLAEQTVPLDLTTDAGTTTVNAVYLQGPDGVVVNAAEPVLPLEMLNVTAPETGFVLRGAGWRGGTFTDLPDRLPLTGAATEDLRAPHPAFFSDIFYPVRPWNTNYFDALDGDGGPTRLALMPAQYRTTAPGSATGILRRFDDMAFRLYYSANIETYTNAEKEWSNTPGLSSPPEISHISSSIDQDAGTVSFEITVTGDPAAGIQEAWIVYTFENEGASGAWLPLDLTQDPADSRLWKGTLDLDSAPASGLRFVVQAVNGVGLVTMMTNQGAYYRAGVDPVAPPIGQLPASVTLEQPAAGGSFGGQQTFRALLTSDGAPLNGLPVTFYLGGQGRLALTGADGRATANFFLTAQPGTYAVTARYDGSDDYAPDSDSAAFEITPGASLVALAPDSQSVQLGVSPQPYVATVTSGGLPLTGKSVALTLDNASGVRLSTTVASTDYAGQVRWQPPLLPIGSYTLKAWFGLPVTGDLDLSSPFHTGSSDTARLDVIAFAFSGFYSPVDNPTIVNKVKAGSTVPVRFSLGGDFGLNIFVAGYPQLTRTLCRTGTVDAIEETLTAGASGLTYDPITSRYTYVWKTDKKWAGFCGTLALKFVDGTERTALFQFSK